MPLAAFLGAGYSLQQALEILLGVTLITLGACAGHLLGTVLDARLTKDEWRMPRRGEYRPHSERSPRNVDHTLHNSDLAAAG